MCGRRCGRRGLACGSEYPGNTGGMLGGAGGRVAPSAAGSEDMAGGGKANAEGAVPKEGVLVRKVPCSAWKGCERYCCGEYALGGLLKGEAGDPQGKSEDIGLGRRPSDDVPDALIPENIELVGEASS